MAARTDNFQPPDSFQTPDLPPTGKSWRDALPIHPTAELFPLMSPDELRALGDDIIKNGLTSPIALWRADPKAQAQLLDGRNRLDSIELVTGKPVEIGAPSLMAGEFLACDKMIVLDGKTDPVAYVVSANLHRRHLTTQDKRDLIANVIKADPSRSDRQIAEMLKVSPTTVGSVRAEMEAKGDVSKLDTRKDSTGRTQPANKPSKPTTKPQPSGKLDEWAIDPSLKYTVRGAQGWTGAIVGTQAEVDAAVERLRNDGAPGHWLVVAPREALVVDYAVIGWLLITAPPSPAVAEIDWVFDLFNRAHEANRPVWVTDRLGGRPHPQKAGMALPRETPGEWRMHVPKRKSPNLEPCDAEEAAAALEADERQKARNKDVGKCISDVVARVGLTAMSIDDPEQRANLSGPLHRAINFAVGVSQPRDDIGPNSAPEAERLRVRNEELERENACLRREIEEAKAAPDYCTFCATRDKARRLRPVCLCDDCFAAATDVMKDRMTAHPLDIPACLDRRKGAASS